MTDVKTDMMLTVIELFSHFKKLHVQAKVVLGGFAVSARVTRRWIVC